MDHGSSGAGNSSSGEDDYINELAKQIASQLNRSVVNTNIASQLLRLANSNPDLDSFVRVCSVFGKFDRAFLQSVYVRQKSTSSPTPTKKDTPPQKNEYFSSASKLESTTQKGGLVIMKKEESPAPASIKREPRELPIKESKGLFRKRPGVIVNKVSYEEEHANVPRSPKLETGRDPQIKVETPIGTSSLSEKARENLREIRRRREAESEKAAARESYNNRPSKRPNLQLDNEARRRPEDGKTPQKPSIRTFEDSPDPSGESYDEEALAALDRDWYTADEFGHAAAADDYTGADIDAEYEQKTQKRVSYRTAQKQKDTDMWEQNRMRTSGVMGGGMRDLDFDDKEENRVHLFVHSLKPPFLDGHQVLTRNKNPVSAVRDPSGDLAQFARKGSLIVRERRQQRERQQQARQAASLAGTTLGTVMGIKDDAEDSTESPMGPSSNKFSDLLKNGQKGASKFSQEKSLKEQRQFLPAYAVREELLKVIRDNQVIVVIGETGSGKTTQLTQFLNEDGYGVHGMIGCTQPRRVAAMSVAKRVSEEMQVKLGNEVGYTIRFEDCTSEKTKIKYMTYGILLREALLDASLSKYSCIIMDEAHERVLNTDILMGLFKKVLVKRRDVKLIITSATLNADRFSQFYGGAPQFTIPGRTFPVDVIHSKTPVEDYVDAAVKQVLSIHLQQGPGDILVFMTGQEDIEATCELIAERMELLDKPEKLEILPIYSSMPADLQAKIFDAAPAGTRKVVVATNIAETSLTLDGISFVVDSGFSKLKVYNPKLGMDTLQIMPISRANAGQRSGRAGRTAKGIAYRLFTQKSEEDEMYEQTIPEIQRTNLAHALLLLKSLGVDNLLEFDFLDAPPQDTMMASLYDLWTLGALDNVGNLTPLGHNMCLFPMDPSLSKLILMSVEYGCSDEMITIVSMLSVPSVFYRPKERQEESDAAREKFFVAESDHLTLLNIFNQWKKNSTSDGWSVRHFLHPKSLRRAQEIREQLQNLLESQRMEIRSCRGDWDVIRKCICTGYFHQAAKVKGLGEFMNVRTLVSMQLHPTSALYGLGYLPDYVIYHELIFTSKQYMTTVTAVDPHWLAELGGVFYSIKEKGYSVRDKRSTEISYSKQMELEQEIEVDRRKYEASKKEEKRVKSKKSAVVLPGAKGGRAFRRGV